MSATYLFSTGVDNTQWYILTADSTVLKVGSNNDSYASPVTDLGFTFHFAGEDYTQFSVNSDGTVRLGSTAVTTSYYNSPFGGTYGNFNNPKICGLGCDGYLVGATETSPADYIAYQLYGSEGTHVLVIEISTGTYNTLTPNPDPCFPVTALAATNITDTSVTLTWADTSNTLATITGHVAVVGNLTPNTLYTFGVQANCASGDASFITTGARTASLSPILTPGLSREC